MLPGGARTLRELMDYLAKEIVLRVVGQDAKARPSQVVIFVRLNGSDKTELCVQHPTGAVEVISTEP
jgi:hypothetical protein